LKDAPSATLVAAIRRVHGGGRAIDPGLSAEAWAAEDPLIDRERRALRMAGDDSVSADIAAKLNLSEGTVRNYLSKAISKGTPRSA
jgi:two-component system response regulator DesR